MTCTNWESVWEFETARVRVALDVAPETQDPADSFEFAEDIESVRDGSVDWFVARVTVHLDGIEVGSDYLGGCAYASARDFATGHRDADPMNRNCSIMRKSRGGNVVICHYFPDMVRTAIAEARATVANLASLAIRH